MTSQDAIPQLSCIELKKAMDEGQALVLLDVREPHELGICKLDYTLHIPLAELRFHMDDLEKFKEQTLVVYCRTGRRSQIATEFLLEAGFSSVKNLTGGIHAWSDEIDASLSKY